jgi:iron complex outermembrane receptor protein
MIRTSLMTTLKMGTAFAALTAASPLLAQSTPPADAPATPQTGEQQAAAANAAATEASSQGDQNIVVTARRRPEILKDVPIAVTAYTGESLERQGALDITALSDTTPNVTFETSRGTNTTLTAFIRGVGQQDPVAGFEAGVGLYLDDIYLNRPQAAVLEIYDVERIEVLRGPQGTLYGRNTIGGAIKYVTRRLPDHPTFSATGRLGTYRQADLILSGSAPIMGDAIKIGASIARLSHDGFGDNLNIRGLSNYNQDVWAARGTLELAPGPGVSIRFTGDYTRDKSNPRNGHRLIPGLLSGAPVLSNVYDTQAGLNTPRQDIKAYGGAMHAEFDLGGDVTLKDIMGYRQDRTATPIDFDAVPAADVDVPAIYTNHQFSNELQLLYEGKQIQSVIGLYFLSASAQNIFDVILATTSPVVLPGLTASTFGHVNTKTFAGFADFTYKLSDLISLSVGGRYTSDRRRATVIRKNLLFGASPQLGGAGVQLGALTSDFRGEKTFSEFTPRASISFFPDPDNTLYASWSKGFKGGGFDPRGLSTAAPDLNGNGTREASEIFDYFLFDPEKVTSYEVGYKASLLDRRLRFALAAFYADYKNVQVPGSVGAVINGVPTFVGVTTNAGKADMKGFEAEWVATLARGFAGGGSHVNFSGTLGYLDAKYKQFITNVAGPSTATTVRGPFDVAAYRRIQNTPKWTMSGTLDMAVPVGGGDLDFSTTLSWRSKTFQFETPSPFLDQPGYSLWDAHLVWTSTDDRFTIGLHGKNLTNKRYITSGYQFLAVDPVTGVPLRAANGNVIPSLGKEGVVTTFYGNPRQLFVSLGVKF